MANRNCNQCIHNEVCYKRENIDAGYANNCGDYCDVNMIVEEMRRVIEKGTENQEAENG